MYRIVILIYLSVWGCIALAQCPQHGDSKNKKHQQLDFLKNRSAIYPDRMAELISFDSLVNYRDTGRFVEIYVYLMDVKVSSKESCNCHSSNKNDYDWHLTVTIDAKHTDRKDRMICEITPKDRDIGFDYVKMLKGKMVTIQGYTFYDTEHVQNSYKDNPRGTNVWRKSCWEIHPVTNIFIR